MLRGTSGWAAVAAVLGLATAGCGGSGGDSVHDLDAPEADDIAELAAPDPGELEVVADGQDRPCGVAVDAENVYWTNYGSDTTHGGSVMKMPLRGGPAVELASGFGNPCAIALDAGGVYWASYGPLATGAIYRVAKSGGGVYALASHLDSPTSLTIRDGRAYWTDGGSGSVQSASVGGGDTITHATGQTGLVDIALDSKRAYWGANGLLMQAPLEGGEATSLLSRDTSSRGIAVGDGGIYWISDDGSIFSVPNGRGVPVELVSGAGEPGGAFDIALQGSSLYWSDAAAGTVSMIPAAGGDVTELARDQGEPTAIAIGEGAIYWTNLGDGTVVRTAISPEHRASGRRCGDHEPACPTGETCVGGALAGICK